MAFLKILAVPVLLFFSAAFGMALLQRLPIWAENRELFVCEGIGAAVYILLCVVLKFFHRNLEFWEVFCHELNHTVFAILCFRRVISFFAHQSDGGEVSFSGKSSNPLILLAPYSFPLFAFCCMLLSFVLIDAVKPYAWGAVGFFLLFHLGSVFRQARLRQTDLRECGYVFSYCAILLSNIFWIPLIAGSTVQGVSVAWDWILLGGDVAKQWIFQLRDWI